MNTLLIGPDDAPPADRIAAYMPISVESVPLPALPERRLEVRYAVHRVDEAKPVALAGDPALYGPSMARVALSGIAAFLVMLTAGLMFAAVAPRLVGYGSVVVVSGSMEPSIRVADVVLVTPSDGVGLGEGAVINFEVEGGTRLHRIAEVTPDGYRTIGDANGTLDSDIVKPSQVQGVGVVVVPLIGLPAVWADRGQWLQLTTTVVLAVGAIYVGRRRWAEVESAPVRS